jgi:hypothetical protein
MDKRHITATLSKYLVNPIVKAAVAVQLAPSSYVILETTGRKSGQPRRTPVGTWLDGNTSGWSPSTVAARTTCATSKPTRAFA